MSRPDLPASRPARLDALFAGPAAAVALAVLCNCLWGAAFPFIKLGYRLYAIGSGDTASILVFAGVRFVLAAALVWLCGLLVNRRPPRFPCGRLLAECCALGLWQTGLQYALYYSAAAVLTGALGSILNSTQSFLGVILAHFLCGGSDRLTPRKLLGCALGFAGVLAASVTGSEGGSLPGMLAMLGAAAVFAAAGPWNKRITRKADSFAVCCLNLGVGGGALALLGLAMGGRLRPQAAGALLVLLFLAFISGAGYVLWALLMKNNPVSRIAVFGLLIPVVTVLLSALLNGETLADWRHLAALALVCAGIWLVNLRPARTKETDHDGHF